MLKHIVTLLMAATLAGGLFAPEAQARGGGGHGGGLVEATSVISMGCICEVWWANLTWAITSMESARAAI